MVSSQNGEQISQERQKQGHVLYLTTIPDNQPSSGPKQSVTVHFWSLNALEYKTVVVA